MSETTIRTNAERGFLLAILLSGVTLVLETAGGFCPAPSLCCRTRFTCSWTCFPSFSPTVRSAWHRFLRRTHVPSAGTGKVSETIRSVEGVGRLHRLHLWSLCSHIPILSAHVDISPPHASRHGEVLEAIRATLRREYYIEQSPCSRSAGPSADSQPPPH